MSCKKAQGFLEEHDIEVKDTTDAGKERRGPADALALAHGVRTIHVARGNNVVTIDMKAAPADDDLTKLLLGPSGNLRAPTIRQGHTLYVGFNAQAYQALIK